MKFFYVFCYVFSYVNITQLGNFSTFRTDGVCLCCAVALLVFRYGSKLVVCYQIGFYEHCYGIVYGGAAHTELYALLEMLHKLLNLKAAVD